MAALCTGLGLAGPAAAETMVVRASGPSAATYRPGSKLADGGSLVLKAGDVVTLLDARGTRTLRGPGRFGVTVAAGAAPAGNVTLAALLDTKRVRRARTGAVRGNVSDAPPAPPHRPNLWLVDMGRSGAFCFADPAAVRLWRADAAKPATVSISGGHMRASVTFAAGETIAAWPASLPLADGISYHLDRGARVTDIRLAKVGPSTTELAPLASALIAQGCGAQLDLLVDAAAAPPGGAGN
ncbi:hypothetical protein [Sphingobium mellinum]|uniref:hypothetical protein n=1 Tax=Sphingobium mellinum TaxID=1387166 RepID=UPI0030EBBDAE